MQVPDLTDAQGHVDDDTDFVSCRSSERLKYLDFSSMTGLQLQTELQKFTSVVKRKESIALNLGESLVASDVCEQLNRLFTVPKPSVVEGPEVSWAKVVLTAGLNLDRSDGETTLAVGDSLVKLAERDRVSLCSGRPLQFLLPWPDREDTETEKRAVNTALKEIYKLRELTTAALEAEKALFSRQEALSRPRKEVFLPINFDRKIKPVLIDLTVHEEDATKGDIVDHPEQGGLPPNTLPKTNHIPAQEPPPHHESDRAVDLGYDQSHQRQFPDEQGPETVNPVEEAGTERAQLTASPLPAPELPADQQHSGTHDEDPTMEIDDVAPATAEEDDDMSTPNIGRASLRPRPSSNLPWSIASESSENPELTAQSSSHLGPNRNEPYVNGTPGQAFDVGSTSSPRTGPRIKFIRRKTRTKRRKVDHSSSTAAVTS